MFLLNLLANALDYDICWHMMDRTRTLSAWAASSWVAPRKLMPLTVNSWSPRFSSPPTSAGPPANINDTNIPWPSSPPTILNPSPCEPFCIVIVRCSLYTATAWGKKRIGRETTKPLYLQSNWEFPQFQRVFCCCFVKTWATHRIMNWMHKISHTFSLVFSNNIPSFWTLVTIKCQPFIWSIFGMSINIAEEARSKLWTVFQWQLCSVADVLFFRHSRYDDGNVVYSKIDLQNINWPLNRSSVNGF